MHGGMAGTGDSFNKRGLSNDVACPRRGEALVGAMFHKHGLQHKYGMVPDKIK